MNDKPTKQPCGFNLILLTCLAVASSFFFLVSSDFLFRSVPLSFSSLAWLCLISKEQEAEYQLIIHVFYVLKICQSCTLTIRGQCTVHKSNIYCYVSLNTHKYTYTYAPQQLEVLLWKPVKLHYCSTVLHKLKTYSLTASESESQHIKC